MYSRTKTALMVIVLSVVTTGMMIGYTNSRAATGTSQLYLSPASQAVSPGATITVTMELTTNGSGTTQVQAGLSYPANLLSCVSIGSPSDFTVINSADKCSNGAVSVYRSRSVRDWLNNGVVVTMKFQALASGTATVNFTSANANGRAVDVQGGTYSIAIPQSGSSSGSGGGSTGRSSTTSGGNAVKPVTTKTGTVSGTTTSPPAPPAPKAPTISNVKLSTHNNTEETISWLTDQPATTQIAYGPDKSYKLSAGSSGLSTEHSVKLDSAAVTLGMTYYLKLTSVNSSGLATTATTSFKTAGFTVQLQIYDQYGKALSGATVYLQKDKEKTDKNGSVTFKNVSYGKQQVKIQYGGKQQNMAITTGQRDGSGNVMPAVSYSLTADHLQARAPNTPVIAVLIGVILAFILVTILIFIRLLHGGRHKTVASKQDPDLYYTNQPPSTGQPTQTL